MSKNGNGNASGRNASEDRIWAVVADDSHVRVILVGKAGLELIHELDHPESRAHIDELLTGDKGRQQAPQNRAGTSGTPGNHGTAGTVSAMEPHTPRKEVEATRFAEEVRDWLHLAASRNGFEGLLLVASPAMLGRLRDKLSKPVQQCILGTLDKNYHHHSLDELHQRLHEAFPEQVPDPAEARRVPARPQKGNQQPTRN